MWLLLAVLMAALAMLVIVYIQGGVETAYPPPQPGSWIQVTGIAAG